MLRARYVGDLFSVRGKLARPAVRGTEQSRRPLEGVAGRAGDRRSDDRRHPRPHVSGAAFQRPVRISSFAAGDAYGAAVDPPGQLGSEGLRLVAVGQTETGVSRGGWSRDQIGDRCAYLAVSTRGPRRRSASSRPASRELSYVATDPRPALLRGQNSRLVRVGRVTLCSHGRGYAGPACALRRAPPRAPAAVLEWAESEPVVDDRLYIRAPPDRVIAVAAMRGSAPFVAGVSLA